jgi:hypothetical protein
MLWPNHLEMTTGWGPQFPATYSATLFAKIPNPDRFLAVSLYLNSPPHPSRCNSAFLINHSSLCSLKRKKRKNSCINFDSAF